MASLTASIFREYFPGSWMGMISKNGEYQREVCFNWPEAFDMFSAIGTEVGLMVPEQNGILDNSRQISIGGWQSDTKTWKMQWHNEFGGYGILKWTSLDMINGVTVIYGSMHECKQESDDPTEHIALCEIFNQNHFKYTIQSHRKGIVEIDFQRLKTAVELKKLMKKQATEPDKCKKNN